MMKLLSLGKIPLIALSMLISAWMFYYFQHRDLPPEHRVDQFIATCTAVLDKSAVECQELLDKWAGFFNR